MYNKLFKNFYVLLFCFFQSTFLFGQNEKDSIEYKMFYFESGNISSEGFIEDGKPNKYWINYFENGKVKSEGNRENFKLNGIWRFYDTTGCVVKEISYIDNKKTGPYKLYSDSGVLKQVYYLKDDLRTGEFIEYYPSGEIKKKGGFKNDTIKGTLLEFAEDDGRVITITKFNQGFIEAEEHINNKDLEGNKQGTWKEFHDNGKIKKEANYRDDKINGLVKEYNKSGQLRSFEKFKNGLIDLDAEETDFVQLYKEYYPDGTVKLEGGQLNGMKNGFFRVYNEEGEFIQTLIYKKDKKIAEGLIDSLLRYQGDWIFYYESGAIKAKGNFTNNLKNNDWIFYYEDGIIEQKGKYKFDKPIGDWNWYHQNTKLKRNEYYVNGLIDGESIEYDSIGSVVVKGNYISGFKDGNWFIKVGDHTEEGVFIDNEKDKEWIHTYENGQIAFKGEFLNGLAVGKHKWYHHNGQIELEGKYQSDTKQGDWIRYNENGEELIKITYKNGIEIKVDGLKYESPKLLD